MRLLIVDDHAVVRRGTMNIIIDRFPDCEFSEAGTLHEARLVLGDTRFDLVILDISLPDGSGLDFLEFAREHDPGLPVIMLSMHHEIEYAQRCLSMGARGYLSKNSAPEELEEAMTAILDGGIYVNPSLLDSRRPTTIMDTLSRQERDVARRLAQGETMTAIAQAMGVSVKTASTYRTRAMRKLDIGTTSGLIRFMLEHGPAGM
ncbi:two component transcriptional regulator, LuxR family [Desulfomicrobium apsheronum]|uniref:Two component transcriptional regulator, LuxR family n=1 Tax=Desulfomicrobium apsheronum TaxID=52560 RepID=A0A1I3S9H9_9BACT|nr:response regulator transcription factor [Desulfomicrobium apsheronum]MDY0227964.1 response regulator transcription factor [Desulfomicrobium apsheronum]SFJ54176.1 two component transcriptional regulator, LuxR family [Desulfomicrobium apsheronum]